MTTDEQYEKAAELSRIGQHFDRLEKYGAAYQNAGIPAVVQVADDEQLKLFGEIDRLNHEMRKAGMELLKANLKAELAEQDYKGVKATQSAHKDALRAIRKTLNDKTLSPAEMLGTIYKKVRGLQL